MHALACFFSQLEEVYCYGARNRKVIESAPNNATHKQNKRHINKSKQIVNKTQHIKKNDNKRQCNLAP